MGKTIHGLRHSRIYIIWRNMKRRCNNPKDKRYSRYGGRGIKVCTEWNKSVKTFAEWAFEHGYNDKLTLDRINNDGDYEPNNCKWSNQQEQCRNRSTNRNITYKGKTKILIDWAKELGIQRQTLEKRLKKGWTVEEAFSIKPKLGNNQSLRSEKNNGKSISKEGNF